MRTPKAQCVGGLALRPDFLALEPLQAVYLDAADDDLPVEVGAVYQAGVAGDFSYVSTAGGAFLEWMEGKPLPGVEVLKIR